MKPDGTPTIEEIMQDIELLQSWEKEELAFRISDKWDIARGFVKNMTPGEVEDLTGLYCFEDVPESNINDFATYEIIDELIDRLSYQTIFLKDKNRLLETLQKVNTI